MIKKKYKLGELSNILNAKLVGDAEAVITDIALLNEAGSESICFIENKNYLPYLSNTKACAVIISPDNVQKSNINLLVVDNPSLAYAKLSKLFDDTPVLDKGIHSTVIIGKDSEIHSSVNIGPNCVIGKSVKIGKNVCIEAGCVIGDKVVIGDDSRIFANVTLYHGVKVGERTLIHSGVVIGADGFGNANDKGKWKKIYQLGSVLIGNDVEIGANTTIDRGAIEDTVIEDGVKLDNLIQIGHNVRIGAHTAIAGCVGIAGSTKIGKYCMIGGGVGINGHITIADKVIITGMSGVNKSITEPGVYSSGTVAMPHRSWWRILNHLIRIGDLVNRIKKLEKKLNYEDR